MHSEEHQEFSIEANQQARLETGVSRAVDAQPFKPQSDVPRRDLVYAVMDSLKERGYEFKVSDSGWVKVSRSGAEVDLSEAVQESLLTENRKLVDEATVTAAVSEGRLGVAAKEDLKTTAAKVAYIDKFGEDQFAKLPLKRQPKPSEFNPDTCTAAEYKDLTRATKLALIDAGKLNDAIIAKIMSRTRK